MPSWIDIGQMLAGIAFLLMAMQMMEDSLRQLAGRNFKLFLKKQTGNKFKALGGGAMVTALLQSSSIVNMLVLTLAGTGVVNMENALALILGANLGTTLNSWMVALLGFNFNVESFAIPVAGITGIAVAFGREREKWWLWMKFLFSLAFLFIAIGFIRSGMEEFVKKTDLSLFHFYPRIVYLLLGILLTAIVQSGSVTIALVLTALHSGVISLPIAMAIVLGSEIGTTLKFFLVSAKGPPVKERIAWGNFIFNIVGTGVLFFFLPQLSLLITNTFGIHDDLIALVFFQSFVNGFMILLFFPFLKSFGRFLLNRFPRREYEPSQIGRIPVIDPDIALETLETETKQFINMVLCYILDAFRLSGVLPNENLPPKQFNEMDVSEKYIYIKHFHGELHGFYLKSLNISTQKEGTERLEQLVSSIRNSMYAAKSIKDTLSDLDQMRNSSNDVKYGFYTHSTERCELICRLLNHLLFETGKGSKLEQIKSLYSTITEGYSENLQLLYKESLARLVNETEISTLINFNREIHSAYKSIVIALKDYLLTESEGEFFDNIPGFIR